MVGHIPLKTSKNAVLVYRKCHVSCFSVDQKQRMNGEPCRASPSCFSSRLINEESEYAYSRTSMARTPLGP